MVILVLNSGVQDKIYINCADIKSIEVIAPTETTPYQVDFMFADKRCYSVDIPHEICHKYNINEVFHRIFKIMLIESQSRDIFTINLSYENIEEAMDYYATHTISEIINMR